MYNISFSFTLCYQEKFMSQVANIKEDSQDFLRKLLNAFDESLKKVEGGEKLYNFTQ